MGGRGGHISAPLAVGETTLGAISLYNSREGPAFSHNERQLLALLADQIALALHNIRLLKRERRARDYQALLRKVGARFHTLLDLDLLLPTVFADVNEVLDSEGLSLWIMDDTRDLVCRQARGGAGSIVGLRVPSGQGIVGLVSRTRQPLLIKDAQSDPRVYRAADKQTGYLTRSLICAPMVSHDRTLGAIQAINKKVEGGQFTEEDLDLLTSLADSAALAIENARLYNELQSSFAATQEVLAFTLDLRDRQTEGHSRRVTAYTAHLARAYGLTPSEVEEITRAALLHDVGKIGIPDSILHKPGELDPDERLIIEKHPRLGYEVLAGIPRLNREARIVLHHQECYDGSGYPGGLKGENIPLGARLFAVADTLDAITSDRPYRRSRSFKYAVTTIARKAGRQFDPRVVEAFLTIPPEEWINIREEAMADVFARRQQRAAQDSAAG